LPQSRTLVFAKHDDVDETLGANKNELLVLPFALGMVENYFRVWWKKVKGPRKNANS
jgi:hypothetical protein